MNNLAFLGLVFLVAVLAVLGGILAGLLVEVSLWLDRRQLVRIPTARALRSPWSLRQSIPIVRAAGVPSHPRDVKGAKFQGAEHQQKSARSQAESETPAPLGVDSDGAA